ncbi:MAG: hypothetical protein HZB56_01380 [Deltaproteobacteria bacterium]|nr:hypothetical protein [Deltaproteobacteria bacterium]
MRALGRSTLVVDGAPAVDAPERLAGALRSLRNGEDPLVDLTRSDELQAVLLAQLANHLRARCQSVSIRILGLRRQDCRLLRYLGLEVDSSGWAAAAPSHEGDDDQASGSRTSGS